MARKTAGPKVVWSHDDNETLLATLKKEKDGGNQAGSGWKPGIFKACAVALHDSPGEEKTADKCSQHYDYMKNKCYKPLAELASKSGLGWDDGKQKVRMTEDVWNKIVQGNPRYEHWKDKEWPYFRVMEKLVEGIIATGAGAFRAGSHNAPIDLDAEFNDENGSEEPAANDAPATPSGAPAILASSDSDREESREPAVAAEVPPTPQATQIQSPSNKRSSSSSNLSTSSSRKRSKTSENNAELVSASINKLAMNLQSNSPERRQRAIKLLQEDGQFSDDSTVDIVMQLSDTSRADSFLALDTQKLRTKFASKLID